MISLIRVRAFDVATFVAHGAAQLGIVGSDVVDEFAFSELYAPVDLGIGHCRLSLAGPEGSAPPGLGESHIRVATKYPATTRERKSVVAGQSVSVRVKLGGRRTIKKKKQ